MQEEIKFWKPKIDVNKKLSIEQNATRQYINNFPNRIKGVVQSGFKTADLCFTGNETLKGVDPRGNPVNKLDWVEFKDLRERWANKEQFLGGLIFFACLFLLYFLLSLSYGG